MDSARQPDGPVGIREQHRIGHRSQAYPRVARVPATRLAPPAPDHLGAMLYQKWWEDRAGICEWTGACAARLRGLTIPSVTACHGRQAEPGRALSAPVLGPDRSVRPNGSRPRSAIPQPFREGGGRAWKPSPPEVQSM